MCWWPPQSINIISVGGFKFPGHTDYLDQELEGNALMLMVQDNLRVDFDDHIPLEWGSFILQKSWSKRKMKRSNNHWYEILV
jgi:4-hydroxy-L-threonine phosphate dehydrogenase PdxA